MSSKNHEESGDGLDVDLLTMILILIACCIIKEKSARWKQYPFKTHLLCVRSLSSLLT